MNGRLVTGDEERYVTGFSIDSRTLASGDLFFAIVAARDGHDFVPAAVKRRAAGVVGGPPAGLPDDSRSVVREVGATTHALPGPSRWGGWGARAKGAGATGR